MKGNTMLISKETEEKRLNDFKKIAENWDKLPEYAQGKLEQKQNNIKIIIELLESETPEKVLEILIFIRSYLS